MDKIEEIKERVLTVFGKEEDFIHTNNGLLNKTYLAKRKKIFFEKNTSYILNEVVKVKQHFPVDDVSTIDMSMDVVVLDRKDYEYMLNQLEYFNNTKHSVSNG